MEERIAGHHLERMNNFFDQLEIFDRQKNWLRAEALKVARCRASARRSRRIREIGLRYLQLARDFQKFLSKQTKS